MRFFKRKECKECLLLNSEILYLKQIIDRLLVREGLAPVSAVERKPEPEDPEEKARQEKIDKGEIIPFGTDV